MNMTDEIEIKQANIHDIKTISEILLDAVNHFGVWSEERVSAENLSREFSASLEEFHILYVNNESAGCMALEDTAPFFWTERIEKGDSLFLRRLAIKRFASGKNLSTKMLEYAVEQCKERNIKTLRLDCDANTPKLHKIYENFGFMLEKKVTLILGGNDYPTLFYFYSVEI